MEAISASSPEKCSGTLAASAQADAAKALWPGMMASVEIKTGSRTVMEYVLSPVMKATNEAGRER